LSWGAKGTFSFFALEGVNKEPGPVPTLTRILETGGTA